MQFDRRMVSCIFLCDNNMCLITLCNPILQLTTSFWIMGLFLTLIVFCRLWLQCFCMHILWCHFKGLTACFQSRWYWHWSMPRENTVIYVLPALQPGNPSFYIRHTTAAITIWRMSTKHPNQASLIRVLLALQLGNPSFHIVYHSINQMVPTLLKTYLTWICSSQRNVYLRRNLDVTLWTFRFEI